MNHLANGETLSNTNLHASRGASKLGGLGWPISSGFIVQSCSKWYLHGCEKFVPAVPQLFWMALPASCSTMFWIPFCAPLSRGERARLVCNIIRGIMSWVDLRSTSGQISM